MYQSKREIRRSIISLRNSLSQNEIILKSHIIQEKLWKIIERHKSQSIMFYVAFGSEVRTQDCIDKALEKGLDVIVPICIESESHQKELLPSKILNPSSELTIGKYHIPEPKPEFIRPFPPNMIDIVVVPGVAFDNKCYRIGYGVGYYDRFLIKCSKSLFVALAYEIQIVEDVLHDEWDIPVDCIITENRIILKNENKGDQKI